MLVDVFWNCGRRHLGLEQTHHFVRSEVVVFQEDFRVGRWRYQHRQKFIGVVVTLGADVDHVVVTFDAYCCRTGGILAGAALTAFTYTVREGVWIVHG